SEYAFGESFLTVLPSIKSGKWQIAKKGFEPLLKHIPTMPLTTLQKRWLKSISLDPRMKLFGVSFEGLEDTEPLFTPEDYCIYDKYSDGDDFESEEYIARFRTILRALRENKPLTLDITAKNGNNIHTTVMPVRLEYSEKDDKLRLLTRGNRFVTTVNLARITSCKIAQSITPKGGAAKTKNETVTLIIKNERNALERCLLHFAHFEKQAERLEDDRYRVSIRYNSDDVTELVIRVLSFGPMVEVSEPEDFRNLIIERLKMQKDCGL
ncbi:MAG: WYL domain-containing protein, partial [Clostridia bacterium]|nr:WYL domain-containing protein [Clostridia bacterium]